MTQRRLSVGRATIRDVATAAGVSLTTVSHVLNDVEGKRVAEATRLRVREVADRLGYRPSRTARGLRVRRTHTLALLSDEIATTPHAGKIILGAQETAFARGWTLVIFNTGDDRELEGQDLDALIQYQIDGLIYATMYHRRVELPARVSGLPVVLLDASCDDLTVPAVVPDEVSGGRIATEELITQGHTRIAFATNRDDIPATHGRMAGYRAALRDAGIRFDRALVARSVSESSGGYRAARKLLATPQRPTAMFCFNDRMAMGAYRAAAEFGLRIPHDLSIIGFDNQELIAEGLYPALTTVALPHYEMGHWAVDTLIDQIESVERSTSPDYPISMPCPLIRRDSVAPPAA